MRRIVVIAVGLLAVDQVSKTLAGHLLADRQVMLAPEWGLTYVTNPGLWIWPDPPDIALFVIQGAAVGVAVLLTLGARWYSRWYRRSLLVDVAVAFLALGVLGNLLDRLFIGVARDWVVTPIATGNLADVAGWATLALLITTNSRIRRLGRASATGDERSTPCLPASKWRLRAANGPARFT